MIQKQAGPRWDAFRQGLRNAHLPAPTWGQGGSGWQTFGKIVGTPTGFGINSLKDLWGYFKQQGILSQFLPHGTRGFMGGNLISSVNPLAAFPKIRAALAGNLDDVLAHEATSFKATVADKLKQFDNQIETAPANQKAAIEAAKQKYLQSVEAHVGSLSHSTPELLEKYKIGAVPVAIDDVVKGVLPQEGLNNTQIQQLVSDFRGATPEVQQKILSTINQQYHVPIENVNDIAQITHQLTPRAVAQNKNNYLTEIAQTQGYNQELLDEISQIRSDLSGKPVLKSSYLPLRPLNPNRLQHIQVPGLNIGPNAPSHITSAISTAKTELTAARTALNQYYTGAVGSTIPALPSRTPNSFRALKDKLTRGKGGEYDKFGRAIDTVADEYENVYNEIAKARDEALRYQKVTASPLPSTLQDISSNPSRLSDIPNRADLASKSWGEVVDQLQKSPLANRLQNIPTNPNTSDILNKLETRVSDKLNLAQLQAKGLPGKWQSGLVTPAVSWGTVGAADYLTGGKVSDKIGDTLDLHPIKAIKKFVTAPAVDAANKLKDAKKLQKHLIMAGGGALAGGLMGGDAPSAAIGGLAGGATSYLTDDNKKPYKDIEEVLKDYGLKGMSL